MKDAVLRIQNDQKSSLIENIVNSVQDPFSDLVNAMHITKDAEFATSNPMCDGIIVHRGLCNTEEQWDLKKYPQLKRIFVWDNSLNRIQSLELLSFSLLEYVTIRNHCFKNGNGFFVIDSCLLLKSIEIGHTSFKQYKEFSLRNCPNLTDVLIGDNSFTDCSKVTFEGFYSSLHSFLGLPKLSTLTMGRNVFKCIENSSLVMKGTLLCLS